MSFFEVKQTLQILSKSRYLNVAGGASIFFNYLLYSQFFEIIKNLSNWFVGFVLIGTHKNYVFLLHLFVTEIQLELHENFARKQFIENRTIFFFHITQMSDAIFGLSKVVIIQSIKYF